MHNQFFFVICKMSASINMTLQLNPIFSFYVKTVFFLCDPQLFYFFTTYLLFFFMISQSNLITFYNVKYIFNVLLLVSVHIGVD